MPILPYETPPSAVGSAAPDDDATDFAACQEDYPKYFVDCVACGRLPMTAFRWRHVDGLWAAELGHVAVVCDVL